MFGVKPNDTPWPSLITYGTIRGFFILGIILGFLLGFDVSYWIFDL